MARSFRHPEITAVDPASEVDPGNHGRPVIK
jgi:hypothetical protein